MYIADERFKKYYDKHIESVAEYFKNAVINYLYQAWRKALCFSNGDISYGFKYV